MNKINGVNSFDPNVFQDDQLNDEPSRADILATYEDIARHTAFISSMPLDVIIEGIENQFDDYIKLEDTTNYVDIFYNSLAASYNEARSDNELFQEEVISVLDEVQNKFVTKLIELFNTRLTLTIDDVESESYNYDELEIILRKLYEFFILQAKKNFKVAIAKDIKDKIGIVADSRDYFKNLRNMMYQYSPLIVTFGPMEFLRYIGDQEVIEFFDDGKVVGNFLRKYSPKLYQNEEFEVELLNYITMIQQIKREVLGNER